jgi:hypothetical protein
MLTLVDYDAKNASNPPYSSFTLTLYRKREKKSKTSQLNVRKGEGCVFLLLMRFSRNRRPTEIMTFYQSHRIKYTSGQTLLRSRRPAYLNQNNSA